MTVYIYIYSTINIDCHCSVLFAVCLNVISSHKTRENTLKILVKWSRIPVEGERRRLCVGGKGCGVGGCMWTEISIKGDFLCGGRWSRLLTQEITCEDGMW